MRRYPSSVITSAVAAGLRQYSFISIGPAISISPSSAMRMSAPATARPMLPKRWASGRLSVPIAVVSVIPHPSITGTPAA